MKHLTKFEAFELQSLVPEIKLLEDMMMGGDDDRKDRFGHLTLEDFDEFIGQAKGWFETPFATKGTLKKIVLGTDMDSQKTFWRVYDLFHKRHVDIPYKGRQEQVKALEAYNYIGTDEWKHDHRGKYSGNKFNF